MRMLTSEARVDAHRFRGGFLGEQDYARLVDAFARLHDAKVFIDDTPSVGILEMRAKARRLKLEHGLDMLVVDYLQLMQGRGRFDNRQQELASISRSLKILAKELEHPDPRAQPAQPRARDPRRPPAAALRPARVGRARAGRRRRACSSSARRCTRSRASASPRPKASPRSSSASSATARPARCGSRSSSSTRGSRTSRRAPAYGRRDGDVIRPTVATVDLDAIAGTTCARFSALLASAPRQRGAPARRGARRHRRRQSERLRSRRRRRGAARSRRPARRCSPARTSRKASRCARPASRVPILVFGALSVSDLDGVFDARPDADGLDAGRRARARGAPPRRAASRLALSSQDRHRHEPARLPARQPAADAAGGARAARTSQFDAVYTHFATADEPESPFLDEQRARFDRAIAALGAHGPARRASATPRTRPRSCATRARGTTAVRPGPAALRHRAAAAGGRRSRAATCPVTHQPYRGGEGPARRARAPATACAGGPTSRARSRSCRPATPTASTRAWPAAASCSSAAAACRSSARVCMDMIMVDVTGLDVSPGDEVVLIGRQGERGDHRARNGGGDRDDSVGGGVPAGSQDREAAIESSSKFEVEKSEVRSTGAPRLCSTDLVALPCSFRTARRENRDEFDRTSSRSGCDRLGQVGWSAPISRSQ